MILYFSTRFTKKQVKLPRPLQSKLRERLHLFAEQPFAPVLDNHPLHGVYAGYRSIDITGSYRAIYEPVGDDAAHFIIHGTHPELYGT